MKKYLYIMVLLGMAGSGMLLAQDDVPTIFYGEAANSAGGENIAVVEQPKNAPNPLGNPLVGDYVAPKAYNAADALPDSIPANNTMPAELGNPQGKMNMNPAIAEIKQQQEFNRFINYENEMMQ